MTNEVEFVGMQLAWKWSLWSPFMIYLHEPQPEEYGYHTVTLEAYCGADAFTTSQVQPAKEAAAALQLNCSAAE